MAKYLQVADEARQSINALLSLVPEDQKPEAAKLIAHVYNYGIRTSPRAVQSTVRLNAVRAACKDLPVSVSMEQRTTDSGYTYNALQVK